ncbi:MULTISPECIES: GntR family transcriptional regulator [Cereibacter]|uniref:GntR family transcriptional regulator n=1 Tax=Cereibacter johrii TaxID=445629 RepID=A0ABX5JAB1_9RHOB|nr:MULTISPECIES: GntR family transcriptional regulator [Cereibacter]QCP87745.1 GntR family transcriptional regulator [Cereibacter sphaeroides]RDS95276.1 GntR family transcriptional regulator [Cereibacter sphaeroides f. sp. denitrificans]ACM04180.1 Transcriptional regulator, GntR family [Cereibacter sphaeroides KD131]ODM42431.1 GntR family transcriptional regulator [Cereibacter johrii]PTM78053.1 GntR family transcriptional regulator [Cereibacter johrii]
MASTTGRALGKRLRPTNREAEAPLWAQVKASLTGLILGEGLQDHARLPSETELCARFGVSRTVVREAMSQMVNEGLIYRLQGKGAFVAGRRDEQDFVGTTVGFSGELADKRKQVTRRILRQETGPATARIRKLLRLEEGERLVYVDRVMAVEGTPRMIVRWAVIERVAPGLEAVPLENRSLYDTIGRQYGIRLARAERWIEAVAAMGEDARLLQVPEGTPVLGIESAAFDQTGQAVEYYTALYLTDRSRLHFTVASPSF